MVLGFEERNQCEVSVELVRLHRWEYDTQPEMLRKYRKIKMVSAPMAVLLWTKTFFFFLLYKNSRGLLEEVLTDEVVCGFFKIRSLDLLLTGFDFVHFHFYFLQNPSLVFSLFYYSFLA